MIVPSIDLAGGKAVQLRQGRDLLLTDPRDPVELAAELGRYGPVAVVDLDAALGRGDNRDRVAECCRVASCRVGGGIRTHEDVRDWIKRGAAKVVVGTKATETVRGFSIRNILDLREILAVIEIQRDPDGNIEAVVFAGKGWGHGVGLCQVGAYGMAIRGRNYREILSHYYTGIEFRRVR